MDSTITTGGFVGSAITCTNYLVCTGNFIASTAKLVVPKFKVNTVDSNRHYSTSKSDSQSYDLSPVPILTLNNINNEDCIKSSLIPAAAASQASKQGIIKGQRRYLFFYKYSKR